MRHSVKTKNIGRFSSYRAATIKSIVKAILKYQRIKTTKTRAKLAQQQLEHLISLAKESSLHSKRLAYRSLGEHLLVKYLFDNLGPLFKNRTSGFSRIIHLNLRRGDNAQKVILELTEREAKEKHKKLKEEKEKPIKDQQKSQEQAKIEVKEKPTIKEKPPSAVKEKPIKQEKPTKKFLGGLRTLFKKERDSL